MKKYSFLLMGLIALMSCKESTKQQTGQDAGGSENKAFATFLEDYYQEGLKLHPLDATTAGDYRYNDTLPNELSTAYRTKETSFFKRYRDRLAEFEDRQLSEDQKMSKAVLAWECDRNLDRLSFRQDLVPLDQMWTRQLAVGQLASGSGAQPFKTVTDYENWLKRLDDYLEWMASAEDRMREGISVGYVLPQSLIKKVVPQLAAMTTTDLETHLFYGPIRKMPAAIPQEEQDRLKEAYARAIRDKVIPAYQKLHDFMTSEYMAAGRASSGIRGVPRGDEYYAHAIKRYTTTDMTAEEIHQIGLNEVARISAEMEKIKQEVGFEGDLKSFFDHVRNKKELMPFTEPEQVIANFNAIHEKMKPQIEKLFDKKPKTQFEVRRTEAFREASASAEYNPGSVDGTRPGIFYVPIPDVTQYNTYSDEDLFLHEAIPGHHFQISLTQENEKLPKFRKTLWYSAYGEGWALYTESLGKELGLYEDPYQYFGMLGAEMHRAIRLVVDTGLHAKAWSREQAIQYSLDNEAESEASITAEIERYMANPGQALSYKIGQLKIRELRKKAEEALGDAFDIREFHNQVLETGCVPLALLEDKITAWIVNKS
ncbi:DUF885 domain-containing protein [Spongiimicrobium sp. 2-473A-2-J]|uniref:DUF885 domain-containing protein n=1 Tax=Eudoraea algarum TaxID=3417568 RepID=UPI003D363730